MADIPAWAQQPAEPPKLLTPPSPGMGPSPREQAIAESNAGMNNPLATADNIATTTTADGTNVGTPQYYFQNKDGTNHWLVEMSDGTWTEYLSDGRRFLKSSSQAQELERAWRDLSARGEGVALSAREAAAAGYPTFQEYATNSAEFNRGDQPIQSMTAEELSGQMMEVTSAMFTGNDITTADGRKMSPSEYIASLDQNSPIALAFKEIDASGIDPTKYASYDQWLRDVDTMRGGGFSKAAFADAKASNDKLAVAGDQAFRQAGSALGDQANVARAMQGDEARLRDAAMGKVPSAAEIQQRQGISDAIATQQAAAATVRGGNAAAAMRQALAGGTSMMSRGIGDAAALRANEQAAARQALTGAQAARANILGSVAQGRTAVGTAQVDRAGRAVGNEMTMGDTAHREMLAGASAVRDDSNLRAGVAADKLALERQRMRDMQEALGNQYATSSGNATTLRGEELRLGAAERANRPNALDVTFDVLDKAGQVASIAK